MLKKSIIIFSCLQLLAININAKIYQIHNDSKKEVNIKLDDYGVTVAPDKIKCISKLRVRKITVAEDRNAAKDFGIAGNILNNKTVTYKPGVLLVDTTKQVYCPEKSGPWSDEDIRALYAALHPQKPTSSSKPTTQAKIPQPILPAQQPRARSGSEEAVFTVVGREELGRGATKEKYLAAQKAQQKTIR